MRPEFLDWLFRSPVDPTARRRALGAMAAGAAGAALPGHAATLGATDGHQSFAQIAFSLAGVATIPVILLEACTTEFEREFGGDALVRFVRACARLDAQSLAAPLPDATLETQARWIVKFLYTGEVVRDGQTEATWYPWCIAWQATRFAKPPGVCGGAFGWWTDEWIPPRTPSAPLPPGGARLGTARRRA